MILSSMEEAKGGKAKATEHVLLKIASPTTRR
jgi:hypothetical protein